MLETASDMPEFYNNLATEKSFKVLQQLKRDFDFILIGGWAVFLYTRALKSKDIDIVVDYETLEKLKAKFSVFKNERLKKYEIKMQEIDIDIYLPFYSQLGLPIEELKSYCRVVEGFLAPRPEVLLLFKTFTYQQRKGSNKGKKDLIDIFALLSQKNIDWHNYRALVKKYQCQAINEALKEIVAGQGVIPELNLSEHKIAKLKKEVLRCLQQ